MNKYETMFIIDTKVEGEAITAKIQKFSDLITSNDGIITNVEEMGKRHLAYAIDYKTEGYYVLVHFDAAPELPKELERNFKNDEEIIRFIVVRVDE